MNNTYFGSLLLVLLVLGCSRSEQQTPGQRQSVSRSSVSTPNVTKAETKPQKPARSPLSNAETDRLAPPVELDAVDMANHHVDVVMHAGEWSGCSLREIIPPQKINRIIRVYDDGFTTEQGPQAQKRYDDLISHLIKSDEKAMDYGLLAQEREIASMIVLTKDGKVYCIEVLHTLLGTGVSAINVSGVGKGARIKVTGQPLPIPPRIDRPRKPIGHIPVSGREY